MQILDTVCPEHWAMTAPQAGCWEEVELGWAFFSSFSFFLFFFFCLFRVTPAAYGSSQARGWIRATAASLPAVIATSDLSCICNPHHSSRQCQILNPVNKARDLTQVLMHASRICYNWAMMRTPLFFIFGHAHSMWILLGQGSNLHHSSNLSHSGDNTDP